MRRSYAMGPQGQVYDDGIRGEVSKYGNYRGDNGVLRPPSKMPDRYRGGKRRKSTKRKGTRRKGTRRKGTRRR